MLPLVSTIGPAKSRSSRWCSGVSGGVRPSCRLPGATAPATGAPGRRASRTTGRLVLVKAGRGLIHLAQFPGRGHVGDHQRERLVLAVLAGPQQRGGILAGGVNGQVKAAQALDGQHLPVPQYADRPGQRVAG